MTINKDELRRLTEAAAQFDWEFDWLEKEVSQLRKACTPSTILALLDELEAARLLLKECDQVIREDGGVYIELRAFLSGRMPASDVIAILGGSAMQEQKP